jgi:hypothetical protein
MTDEIHIRSDGHFEMPLPSPDNARMPNNRPIVEKGLKQLNGMLSKNQQYRDDNNAFMDGLLEHGFAERAPDELDLNNGKIWYIPQAVPQSERGTSVQNMDLRHDELPMERILGI